MAANFAKLPGAAATKPLAAPHAAAAVAAGCLRVRRSVQPRLDGVLSAKDHFFRERPV